MKEEKHDEILKEVQDEVETALKDRKGLLAHQRRLAFLLSLGAANLIESYFHRLNIIKEGSKIDHSWFKRKKQSIFEKLEKQITSPISSIGNINAIINIVIKIEEKRDDIAYGAPSTENALQEKINLFYELRRILKC